MERCPHFFSLRRISSLVPELPKALRIIAPLPHPNLPRKPVTLKQNIKITGANTCPLGPKAGAAPIPQAPRAMITSVTDSSAAAKSSAANPPQVNPPPRYAGSGISREAAKALWGGGIRTVNRALEAANCPNKHCTVVTPIASTSTPEAFVSLKRPRSPSEDNQSSNDKRFKASEDLGMENNWRELDAIDILLQECNQAVSREATTSHETTQTLKKVAVEESPKIQVKLEPMEDGEIPMINPTLRAEHRGGSHSTSPLAVSCSTPNQDCITHPPHAHILSLLGQDLSTSWNNLPVSTKVEPLEITVCVPMGSYSSAQQEKARERTPHLPDLTSGILEAEWRLSVPEHELNLILDIVERDPLWVKAIFQGDERGIRRSQAELVINREVATLWGQSEPLSNVSKKFQVLRGVSIGERLYDNPVRLFLEE